MGDCLFCCRGDGSDGDEIETRCPKLGSGKQELECHFQT